MGSPAVPSRALVRPFFIISSMSYLVIARKWRPQTFSDVIGQEHITRTLQNAISAGRLAHAYLFTGVRGVGKTTAARILAKALNCAKGPTPEPCNHCSQCQEISQGSSIDVLEIDGASNRGIDEIRQIIENVRYQPAHGRFKIYIIDEVHQVTKDAFNALLKTLEEPPPSVKFVLATTEPHRLPATILSRCQRYDFRRIELREISNRLSTIAKSEALEITPGALALLAREGDGSMRDAQSLLEQVLAMAAPGSTAETARVDEALLQDVLGLADRGMLYDISAAVLTGNSSRCVELVAQAAAQGRDINRLARDLVEHFRNLLVARLTDADVLRARDPAREINTRVLDLPDQEIADLHAQAAPVALETLLDYFDFMTVGAEEISRSATPRFVIESVLIRLAELPQTLPVTELIARLERLEAKLTADPGGAIKEKGAAWSQAKAAPLNTMPQEPSSGASAEGTWREFITAVGREKKFLASHLGAAKPLETPPGRLKIGITERHHLAYLLDGDNLATLKELAKKFFQQEVNVQIVALEPDDKAASQPPKSEGGERSAMVSEALRIFGGSVRNVRRDES
jgi:DNA polymerase-3 subunit gamma/tau